MFKLNDRVRNTHLGEPNVGRIIAVISPDQYRSWYDHYRSSYSDKSRWDSLFPGWESDPVFWVRSDEPVKAMTKEDADFHGVSYDNPVANRPYGWFAYPAAALVAA